MDTNLYGAAFVGCDDRLFVATGRYLPEEEVAHLSDLFPNTIYFSMEDM